MVNLEYKPIVGSSRRRRPVAHQGSGEGFGSMGLLLLALAIGLALWIESKLGGVW